MGGCFSKKEREDYSFAHAISVPIAAVQQMNMTLIETRQPSTGYGDYDSDYSDQMNNEDIMEVVEKI
ncbi:unnamed protein product [Oikopleura dioica]|uniref:Uncharacterized protein n=1 Tax=Oikopleura dioica TaxID=34765 RepID=E4Z0U1_OIKDI|nr:unnamed protein product [Oikopleura dioica]